MKGHSIPFCGSRSTRALRFLLGAMFVLLCMPFLAIAQSGRGSISGVVSDPSGGVINGVKVTALNRATGIALHTATNESGLYSFVSLNPGLYVITASQTGFESFTQNNVPVTVDQVTTVNIALKVGNVTEMVEVTATAELTDTNNSTVGQLIESSTIERVPLLTRNVFDLVQMSAGVTPANGTPNSSSSYAITNISSGRPGVDVSSYTINGAIQGSVYFMLDGSPLGVAENNTAAVIPAMEIPEDGVDEIRVETQNTPASYQSGGAGVISVASKSGGDEFHGDVFGVFRPDVLAANESFNKSEQLLRGDPNKPPAFHRYQEGGAIGGPILHKKLFFFADYEATQQKLYDPSNSTFTVPTSKERIGDFSADNYTIYNPLAPDLPNGMRQEFPVHNVLTSYIDPNTGTNLALNPIALKMLSMMPKCNYPDPTTCDAQTDLHLNNYRLAGLDPATAQRFDVRMDYYLSDKQRLFGRFSFDRLSNAGVNSFNTMWDPYYAQNITNGRNFLIGYDYTISPTTVLQLRYSFTRHYEDQGGDPRQNGFDITTLGFPASLAAVQAYKTLPIAFFDDVGGGVGGTCCWNTFIFASENHDANATLTKTLGRHELSFGAEFMKRFMNQGQPPASSGSYNFEVSATDQSTTPLGDTTVGGSDFASFLLGMGGYPGYEGGNFTQDLFVAEASPYYAAFIQDTYHPLKNLTITAGLRWDIFGGKTERQNRLEYFDPKAVGTDPSSGLPFTGGEVFANSSHRSPFTTNMKDFGPRLGLAWNAAKHLVVRGGAGFYYGPSVQMVSGAAQNSDGYSTYNNWSSTCYNGDANSPGGLGNTVFNGTNQCAGAAPGSPAPSVTGIYSLSNPFPTGLVPPSQLQPSGLETGLGGSLNTMLHSQRTPVTYNFNFGLDYELPHQVVVSVGYVGSRGLFLPLGAADLNQLTLSQIKHLGIDLGYTDPADFMAAQPFPQFTTGGVNGGVAVHGYPGGDSDYSSLQMKVQKRMTKHFTTLASFTWAKLITDDGNPPLGFVGFHAGAPQDWRDMSYEHSVSPQDVKYQLTWQVSYDLPIGEGRGLDLNKAGNAILGGWTADGIFYLSSGLPIPSPIVGNNAYLGNQRTDMVCDPSKGAPHTAAAWFNPTCFVTPGTENGGVANPFIPGTAPAYLDHVRTMGANNLDVTLSKTVKVGEKRNLRFDVSSYNVANRPQLGAPNVSTATNGFSGFGNITQTINTPRQFQFGARFTF
ncbi:MAG TPA: carboxypeptidase regulatory-like domain-containing protein [Candidatus Dormibacteraeota bacterium]|nr:carboxypeptidase regulatory-like domain-containing protein [Candidatus Dormibacteraeota bacterium]